MFGTSSGHDVRNMFGTWNLWNHVPCQLNIQSSTLSWVICVSAQIKQLDHSGALGKTTSNVTLFILLRATSVRDERGKMAFWTGKAEKKSKSIIILLKMVLAVTEQVIFNLFRHRLVTEQVENNLFRHQSQIRPFSRIVYTSRILNR